MLSAFQETKMRLFFDILDYDRSGFVELQDFESIGENIGLILDLKPDEFDALMIQEACRQVWKDVYAYVDTNSDEKASFYEWLRYADENIVNCSLDAYDKYVNAVVEQIFQLFDHNRDNYISLREYLDLFMSFRLEVRYSAKAFTKIDLNNDDQISRDELRQAVQEFFRSDDERVNGNWLFGSWKQLTV